MKKTLSLLFAFIPVFLIAQNTLYFMDRLPQSTALNPAFIPEVKFHIGLPGMGGISTQAYNSGFNYSELNEFIDNLSTTGYSPDEFVNSIGDYNTFTSETKACIFNMGFKLHEKGYFSLLINFNNATTLKAASDIAYLIADYDEISLEKFPLKVEDVNLLTNSYLSIGFTYSRKINENLTLGISPKLNCNLLGIRATNLSYIVNATTETDEFGYNNVNFESTIKGEALLGLPTAINPEAIFGDELDLDKGLLSDSWIDDYSLSDIFRNKSLAVDLGATYQYSHWSFYASILNIGASKWKSNSYQLNGSNEIIRVKEMDKIKIGIPTTAFLGAMNQFSQKWSYGLLLNNTFYKSGTATSGTVSLNGSIGRMLSTSASYTFGYQFNNLGLGLRLRFFPGMDFFCVTDNLIQAFRYKNTQRITAAVGVNLSFGVKGNYVSSSTTNNHEKALE